MRSEGVVNISERSVPNPNQVSHVYGAAVITKSVTKDEKHIARAVKVLESGARVVLRVQRCSDCVLQYWQSGLLKEGMNYMAA